MLRTILSIGLLIGLAGSSNAEVVKSWGVGTGSIGTAKIAAGAIDTPKLALDAVTSSSILDLTIQANNIANGAVDTTKVGSGAIDTPKLLNAAVTTNALDVGAVDTTKISAGAVDTPKLSQYALVDINKMAVVSRLGIGTTAPSEALHIGDTPNTAAQMTRYRNTTGNVYFGPDGSADHVCGGSYATCLWNVSNTPIIIGTNNAVNVNIPAAAVTTGGALCLNASHVLTKCTSAVDASGNCTCP